MPYTITKTPATIPVTPQKALPSENAHAAQPNDSEVSSVTKIRWKAFSDISVDSGAERKIAHGPQRQAHQSREKEDSAGKDGIDHFSLRQQVHQKPGHHKGVADG